MKFFSCVIYSLLLTFVLLLHGPAVDQQHRYRYTQEDSDNKPDSGECEDGDTVYSNDPDAFAPSKSYCIDRNLYAPGQTIGNEYFDHCCYIRYQEGGQLKHGCKGLKELEYLDIKETIYKYEQENGRKVFEVSCNSFFIYLSVAAIISLLGLLL